MNISGNYDLDVDPGQLAPDLNDAICIFCGVMFANDKRRELWIQCLMCNMEAYIEYLGPESDNTQSDKHTTTNQSIISTNKMFGLHKLL